MKVRDLFSAAIEREEKSLVYAILYLMQKGYIRETDDESKIDFSKIDNEAVDRLFQENPLGIRKIRIFCLMKNKKRYEFIYAENEREAAEYFRELFKQEPIKIFEYPLDFTLAEGKAFVSFREIRKRFEEFPAYLGYFEKKR